MRVLSIFAVVLVAAAARAQEGTAPEPVRGQPDYSATVRGEKSVLMEPQSIGVLDRPMLQRNEGLFLDDTLNLLPGVRFESRTVSGGQRITIRGYGNGTNFNGTGYKAYMDGIPLTDAEGTTILDDVDISTLGRIEVIKGPASSLYGTGIAGVVQFSTLRPEPDGAHLSQQFVGGNPGLFRSNTRVDYGSDSSSFLINYGHQQSDGYRVHSESNKDYVLLSGDYRPGPKQTITYSASYNHSFDKLAGQLTEQQFVERQNVAEAAYLANDGHVAIDSVRLGVSHKYEFTRWLGNTTSVFGSGYQLNQPFAVGLSDNMALNMGGRTEFTARAGTRALGIEGMLGTEIERTNSFKKSYGLTNGVTGPIRGDLQVVALQSNTFAQANVLLPSDFKVTGGASLNIVRYNIHDRLANSGNPSHLDQSGNMAFDPFITPRLAVQKGFGHELSVYAQVSRGYSPPVSGAVVIPQTGQVNKDIRPETGTLFELGSKGNLFEDRFGYEVALFDMTVNDKLTPQAVTASNGSTLYTITTNAGSQHDRGIELSARYALVKDPAAMLSLVQVFSAYTYSHFTYDGFKSDANNNASTVDYSGKKVVGVPDHVFDLGVDVGLRAGLYANTTFEYVGATPLTYDNTQHASSYTLFNAKLGYLVNLPAGFRLDASAGSKNLFDRTYYTMVFLNANYNGPPPNVYLPGPGTTFYGMVTLSKTL